MPNEIQDIYTCVVYLIHVRLGFDKYGLNFYQNYINFSIFSEILTKLLEIAIVEKFGQLDTSIILQNM